jgi:hypothetical protein
VNEDLHPNPLPRRERELTVRDLGFPLADLGAKRLRKCFVTCAVDG